MNWITNIVNTIRIGSHDSDTEDKEIDGVWTKCGSCHTTLLQKRLEKNLFICPSCDHHLMISARNRLISFLDADTTEELFADIKSVDLLKFKDSKKYTQRLSQSQANTKEQDALLVMSGKLSGMPIMSCAFEFKFMGGSMGSVVGEKFVLAAEKALADKTPLICFVTSGGARMQENMFSLMQMARTAAIIEKLKQASVPFIPVLTHPTFGGVSASLAMLGDINVAEPKALIGFAGPKVIEQTVKQKLPKGFQTSEFLVERGVVDTIIHRKDMRTQLTKIISMLTKTTIN